MFLRSRGSREPLQRVLKAKRTKRKQIEVEEMEDR